MKNKITVMAIWFGGVFLLGIFSEFTIKSALIKAGLIVVISLIGIKIGEKIK